MYEPPEPLPPQPLFTTTRLVLGGIALALAVWVGGTGCARADLEQKAAAATSALVGHPVKVSCPGIIASVLMYQSNAGRVEFDADGSLPDETKLTAEVCAGLQRLVSEGSSLDLACLDNDSCSPEDRRVGLGVTVLSHEAGHLSGIIDEAQTECFGQHNSTTLAQALGASPATATQIAEWQTIFAADMLPARYRGAC